MKLTQCPKFHFYDADKDATCPVCARVAAEAAVKPKPEPLTESQKHGEAEATAEPSPRKEPAAAVPVRKEEPKLTEPKPVVTKPAETPAEPMPEAPKLTESRPAEMPEPAEAKPERKSKLVFSFRPTDAFDDEDAAETATAEPEPAAAPAPVSSGLKIHMGVSTEPALTGFLSPDAGFDDELDSEPEQTVTAAEAPQAEPVSLPQAEPVSLPQAEPADTEEDAKPAPLIITAEAPHEEPVSLPREEPVITEEDTKPAPVMITAEAPHEEPEPAAAPAAERAVYSVQDMLRAIEAKCLIVAFQGIWTQDDEKIRQMPFAVHNAACNTLKKIVSAGGNPLSEYYGSLRQQIPFSEEAQDFLTMLTPAGSAGF